MKIVSLIRRLKGTTVTLDDVTYHFQPEVPAKPNSPHVADVENERHIQRFLAIPEGYALADGAEFTPSAAQDEPVKSILDPQKVAPAPQPKPSAEDADAIASMQTHIIKDGADGSQMPVAGAEKADKPKKQDSKSKLLAATAAARKKKELEAAAEAEITADDDAGDGEPTEEPEADAENDEYAQLIAELGELSPEELSDEHKRIYGRVPNSNWPPETTIKRIADAPEAPEGEEETQGEA